MVFTDDWSLVFEFRHSLAARTLNGCILCFVVPKICFLLFQIITGQSENSVASNKPMHTVLLI